MGKIEFANCQDARNQKKILELDCPRCHESGGIEAFVKDGIEMVFNRRNTFGPLHVPVSYRGSYGPDTFLKTGDLWEDEVQLYSQGLPEKVTLRKID